jgi:uncharacterized protein (TIGR03382 family)
MSMKSVLAIAVIGVVFTLGIDAAEACMYVRNMQSFAVDESATVEGELKKPELVVDRIKRGTGPDGGLFKKPLATSCDDLGYIGLWVEPERDDVGYVFEVTEGKSPDGVSFSDEPVALTDRPGRFTWIDGAEDKQEPIEFTMTVTPIAKNGEPGPTSEPVVVSHPGSGGCGTTGQGSAPGAAWLLVLGGLVLVWRRG